MQVLRRLLILEDWGSRVVLRHCIVPLLQSTLRSRTLCSGNRYLLLRLRRLCRSRPLQGDHRLRNGVASLVNAHIERTGLLIWGAALEVVAQSPCIAGECERLSLLDAVTRIGLYLIAILLCISLTDVVPIRLCHQAKTNRKPDK